MEQHPWPEGMAAGASIHTVKQVLSRQTELLVLKDLEDEVPFLLSTHSPPPPRPSLMGHRLASNSRSIRDGLGTFDLVSASPAWALQPWATPTLFYAGRG